MKEYEPQPIGYDVFCTTHGKLGNTVLATDAVNLFLCHMRDIRDNHPETPICESYDFVPIYASRVESSSIKPH